MSSYSELPDLLSEASSGMGRYISLGEEFISRGIREMDNYLIPKLKNYLGGDSIPRVLPSYALLLWFTIEVCLLCCGMCSTHNYNTSSS